MRGNARHSCCTYLLLLTALLTSYSAADAGQARGGIPRAARKYLPQVVREAHYRNLDAAIIAGQIHQESAWDGSAASAYAAGLAQFTPATEAWAKAAFPRLRDGAGSSDPRWAIRAMCLYDRWLLDRTAQGWPLALRAYNGGLGWIIKEGVCPGSGGTLAAVGDKSVAPTEAGFECCRRFRTGKSCQENLAYPEMILTHWAPMYRAIINPFGGDNS